MHTEISRDLRSQSLFAARCRSLSGDRETAAASPDTPGPGVLAFRQTLGKLANAGRVVDRWGARRSAAYPEVWPDVRDAILTFDAKTLYTLGPADVEAAARATTHALGRVRAAVARAPENADIDNCSAPYPIMLLLHECLESRGRVPVWNEFVSYMKAHRTRLLDYYLDLAKVSWNGRDTLDWSAGRMPIVQYRLGNVYYAFLREMHVFLSLRRLGLDVHYHLLADLEFKADLFIGNLVVEIYVTSSFKNNDGGRKLKAAQVSPGIRRVTVTLEQSRDGGTCWLASKDSIMNAHAEILRVLNER